MNKKNRKSPIIIPIILGLFLMVLIYFAATLYGSHDFQPVNHGKFLKPEMKTINLWKLSGPIMNPLMGWAPWATAKNIKQPFTLVYVNLTWRDFEPREGVYDFASFENKKHLVRWREEGKRVVFRFVTDVPRDESHMDIPDWLFEKMNGDGDIYDNKYGKGFGPNYSNPIFMKYHQLVIQALGDQYGRDGFFAFVELGSLGHWGEWHVYSGLRELPSEDIRNQYVNDYINAFPDTFLLMRRPFTITRDMNLGLYNDMTGSLDATTSWLDWIKSGGDYLPNENNTLVPMPNGWQYAPVGGEQAPVVADEEMYGSNLEVSLRLLTESHTTFIGPGGPYDVELNSPIQKGLDQALTIMGYRLYIESVEMPVFVNYGKEITINFNFSNDGIAPFYYEWPAKVYLLNENGEMVNTYPVSMDIRKILPGVIYKIPFVLPVNNLENGKYTIGFAIIDPLSGLPGVKLANENKRDDLIQLVGTFDVQRLIQPPQ